MDERGPNRSLVGGRCPNCGKPTVVAFRPFCSKRCAQVDLGRWLGGHYRVETSEAPAQPSDGEDERG